MVPVEIALILQFPFEFGFPTDWLNAVNSVLNVLYALSLRGYLLLLLGGFVVYATGLSDTSAKLLVGIGVFLYVLGPLATNLMGSLIGFETITAETARSAWVDLFGVSDMEIVDLLLWVGEIVAAICCLTGAILYFTPTSGELGSRGRSLIVRSLLLAPVLVFLHVTPWI